MTASTTASIHSDLAEILGSIRIASDASFSFRGEPEIQTAMFPVPVRMPGQPVHPVSDNALVRSLQAVLYGRCYCHRVDSASSRAGSGLQPSETLMKQLSEANRSVEHWEGGWRVYMVLPTGTIYVTKGDRERSALPGEYVSSEVTFQPPAVGTVVSLRAPRESYVVQTGFYFVFGESLGDVWDRHFMLRFYFNASPTGTVHLIRYLSGTLNRFQIPFHLKALTDPTAYTRSDSMVLYLARRHYHIVARIVLRMPADSADGLRTDVPLFTRQLRPGVGLAEDPNTSESFGMHRCRLVAEGIVDAWTRGRQETSVRARSVRNRFLSAGLDPDRPYLSRGLMDLPEVADGNGAV
jgi:hypothetical protein